MALLRHLGVEAGPVVGDGEQQAARFLPQLHRDMCLRRVLGGILQGLEAAEVDGSLDLGGEPSLDLGLQADVERTAIGSRSQRLDHATVAQQRRVDAVGEVAQLLDRVLHVGGQRIEHLGRGRGVVGKEVLRQSQVHRQRDEVLLRAVVQVAFDLASFSVGGRDDAGA